MREKPRIRPVAELLAEIPFSAENIVEAAVRNSVLFADAAEFRLDCLYKRAEAKAQFEYLQAEKALKFRADAAKYDEKLTEAACAAKVCIDKDVSKARVAYDRADALEEYSKLITDLFRMRRDCLEMVKDMVRSEISAQAAIEAGNEKLRKYRQRAAERFPASDDSEE